MHIIRLLPQLVHLVATKLNLDHVYYKLCTLLGMHWDIFCDIIVFIINAVVTDIAIT